MSLKGKTIVVTGASKGLGLGIVKRLCEEGANIIAHYNSGDISAAENLAGEAGVAFRAFQADLSKEEEVLRLADQICACGEIYGLVNNAGVCLFEDFFDITPESYDFTFNVNVKAVFLLTQKIAQKMAKDGVQGRIVNFGGGAPLKIGDDIIGGIGVSGGSAEQDIHLADFAVEAFREMTGQK